METNTTTGGIAMDSSLNFSIFEKFKNPVCVITSEGVVSFGNAAFRSYFQSGQDDVQLDWAHPLFPEYRKRIARAYLTALGGNDVQCFAVLRSSDDRRVPVEIILFPINGDGQVTAILAMIKVLDSKLLVFDSSTLSYISEESFQYDNLHYEFSPIPIVRINENFETIKWAQVSETYFGFNPEELADDRVLDIFSLVTYDSDRIKNCVTEILNGSANFHRVGEVKLAVCNGDEKISNIVMYPIVQKNTIVAAELMFEDVTVIKDLREEINTMNRIQMLGDITKGFLHSLNNTINVVLSKTQLLMQITEKESVVDGIHVIEESALDVVEQIRRVQNFIGENNSLFTEKVELLTNIIEDAIEFAKIKFKVEDKEKRRSISIDRKYYSGIYVKTDTRLLREIVIFMILKASEQIARRGSVSLTLKESYDICLTVEVSKSEEPPSDNSGSLKSLTGIDIRRTAERIKVKIIEEESADKYTLKAIFPNRIIVHEKDSETETDGYKLRDLDILIVEDEKALKKILFDLFDRMGNRVFICENGKEALEEFRSKNYDIVITDYSTPGLTGIELAARVKEINENVLTVLLTGWMIDNLQAYRNVLDLFLPKPFILQDLITNISRLMKDRKGRKNGR
jgi:CheY-like chemotaxis protein